MIFPAKEWKYYSSSNFKVIYHTNWKEFLVARLFNFRTYPRLIIWKNANVTCFCKGLLLRRLYPSFYRCNKILSIYQYIMNWKSSFADANQSQLCLVMLLKAVLFQTSSFLSAFYYTGRLLYVEPTLCACIWNVCNIYLLISRILKYKRRNKFVEKSFFAFLINCFLGLCFMEGISGGHSSFTPFLQNLLEWAFRVQ